MGKDTGGPAFPSQREHTTKGGMALRDYFLARSEQAGVLWIYRERLAAGAQLADSSAQQPGSQWYLQGLFG